MASELTRRKAKIICTLGPSTQDVHTLEDLVRAGMNIARINFSHGTYEFHAQLIGNVREVSRKLNRTVGILQDLQGPKIRVGRFEKGSVTLSPGDDFILSSRERSGNKTGVSVTYDQFHKDVTPGESILLDDGNMMLKVDQIDGFDVNCKVVYGGLLKDHKGVNLPDTLLSMPALTEKDRADLAFGLQNQVDFVALSFVQRPEDVIGLREEMARHGRTVPIISKIEKPQAVSKIESIIELSDAIMIARGDLGVEMATEEVPICQKRIIRHCNHQGVPVITATQMLESMIFHPRPTRAETSDVANAILDGSDAVMLSGETAVGQFPIETVKTMDRIITLTEQKGHRPHAKPQWDHEQNYPPSVAIGYSACQAAEMVQSSVIVCLTQSGKTAKNLARFRPSTPILALTNTWETYNQMALLWGVTPQHIEHLRGDIDEVIQKLKEDFLSDGRFQKGARLVFTAGLPFSEKRPTNMLRVEVL